MAKQTIMMESLLLPRLAALKGLSDAQNNRNIQRHSIDRDHQYFVTNIKRKRVESKQNELQSEVKLTNALINQI